MFFDDVKHLGVFRVIELFRHLNPLISSFPSYIDQFLRPRSIFVIFFVSSNYVIFYSEDLSSSYLSKNIKIPNYSPLYYLIRDYLSKLVSLELVLMRVRVYSMTSRIRFVTH